MAGGDRDAADFFGVLDGLAEAQDYEQTKADEELADRLDSAFFESVELKNFHTRNWELYDRYLRGDQLIIKRDTGDVIRLSPEDRKRLRSTNNQLRPTARSLVGKLTRVIPTCRVIPPTADFEDQHGALTADTLLQYIRRKEDLDLKYQQAMAFLPAYGNAFLQVYWDILKGDKKAACPLPNCNYVGPDDEIGNPCPHCQMQREQEAIEQQQTYQQEIEYAAQANIPAPTEEPPSQVLGPLQPDKEIPTLEEVKTGDVCVRVIDPRDFFIDVGCESIQDARWVCYRTIVPVSSIRAAFPEMSMFVDTETNFSGRRNDSTTSLDNYSGTRVFNQHAYLYEFHEKTTELYPKGRIVWMCNKKILREIESPYSELGRFPFYHFGWDKNQGDFWFESFMVNAWHRQRELNNNETAIREHTELLLHPKLMVPMASRVTADEINATTGQIIHFNPVGGEPKILQYPSISQDLWRRGDVLSADIRGQAAITDSDMGLSQTDPNGRALAIISAEADQQLGPTRRWNNREWRELHRALLLITQKNYYSDRTWTVAGQDGVEVYYFSQMNLSPGWDIELEEYDAMSTNPALRLQQAMDLANLGYFVDKTTGLLDKKEFARAARLLVPSRGYDLEATERAMAAQIPKKLENGEQFQPRTFDDPMIFAEVLLGWLRGPGRRADIMLSAQVEQIWQFYVTWAVTQVMPQMAGPGGTGAPGGAGAGGPDQSAAGGSSNNPGHLGTDRPIQQEAGESVQRADSTAERGARVASKQ